MSLNIVFEKNSKLLRITYKQSGKPDEIIQMEAHSGGWDAYKALPKGKWTITENPSGDKTYFALFYNDKKINDQFKQAGKWRDGIRFGFHSIIGSHGCIMTKPAAGETYVDAEKNWKKIQTLIRTKRLRKIISYQNNENPRIRDNTTYRVSSYGELTVAD